MNWIKNYNKQSFLEKGGYEALLSEMDSKIIEDMEDVED